MFKLQLRRLRILAKTDADMQLSSTFAMIFLKIDLKQLTHREHMRTYENSLLIGIMETLASSRQGWNRAQTPGEMRLI